MATNKPNPESKKLVPEQNGYRTDPMSLEIARDVLRRVRKGELSKSLDLICDEEGCQ